MSKKEYPGKDFKIARNMAFGAGVFFFLFGGHVLLSPLKEVENKKEKDPNFKIYFDQAVESQKKQQFDARYQQKIDRLAAGQKLSSEQDNFSPVIDMNKAFQDALLQQKTNIDSMKASRPMQVIAYILSLGLFSGLSVKYHKEYRAARAKSSEPMIV